VRPVNLIPPEDRRGEHAPLRAGAVSYAIVGFLALALVGVVLMVLTGNEISDNEAELAALEAEKAQADVAAADLAEYEQFATLEQSRSETVSSLAQSRFDWERVLNELALVIPRRVTLESLSATAGAGVSVGEDVAAATGSGAFAGPSLQISGCAKGQEGTARFLAAMRDIDGVTRVGMQSSSLGEEAAAGAPAASAPTSDSAAGASGPTDCQTKPQVARFEVSVVFDAVPVPVAAAPATGTPAATPAPATETATSETVSGADGVAETSTEQQAAADSANEQVSEAESGAEAVGVTGE
jgi:Tfp pilus assembly protein PilN